jgi:catechol 2,3-dioxygenase-like lactoylglutathione lyase family enzyme
MYEIKSNLKRMDNVLIVVDDLEVAKAFFAELGMELEGETTAEGRWVDRVVGLNNVRADITMMRTPDGHGRVELTKFHRPPAVRAEPESAPTSLPACAATVPNSSARSRSTRTSTGSASCVALRASSSDSPSNSAINR